MHALHPLPGSCHNKGVGQNWNPPHSFFCHGCHHAQPIQRNALVAQMYVHAQPSANCAPRSSFDHTDVPPRAGTFSVLHVTSILLGVLGHCSHPMSLVSACISSDQAQSGTNGTHPSPNKHKKSTWDTCREQRWIRSASKHSAGNLAGLDIYCCGVYFY